MKRILSLLILSLSIFSIGCSKNEENTVSNDTANKKFEQYNILDISEVEIDTTEEYEGDEYITARVKVTNNSEDILKDVTVDFSGYSDNVIIDTIGESVNTSIKPGESAIIERLFERKDNIDSVKINTYNYQIAQDYFEIDLINNLVEIGYVN